MAPMTSRTRDMTRMGMCIALAVASGYAFLHVPNVELVTSISFLSGYFLGRIRGCLVGAMSMFLFSLFNPLGVPFIPVFIAQVVFMGLAGFAGGMWKRWTEARSFRMIFLMGLAGSGLLLTLLYDAGTNLGFALGAGLFSQTLGIIGAGLVFSLVHVISNTVLFATLVPVAVKMMQAGRNTQP